LEPPIEIAVVSGKGGTGKTMLASSLAELVGSKVMADCDVDAPNLHLLLKPTGGTREPFFSTMTAVLNKASCKRCGQCLRACRFDAIREHEAPDGWLYSIDPLACEGCGVCVAVCETDAIILERMEGGACFVSDSEYGPLVHAMLAASRENSDHLVNLVREQARRIAGGKQLIYIIIDGPPGIGPAAIATLTGVSLAVVMTEPTLSGIHDLRRVIELARGLGVRTAAVLNKYDLNLDVATDIEGFLVRQGIPLIGRIPFSSDINAALGEGKIVVKQDNNQVARDIKEICTRITGLFAPSPWT
jgi:MinD superfamily P-loop ATPase